MKKIRINKQPTRRPRKQQSLQQLLSRVLGVFIILVILLYCVLPLAINPDIMRWLQSGDFVMTVVIGVVLYVIYSMVNQSNIKVPKQGQIKVPVVLKYEICSVCKQEKLLCDLYDINGRIICDECINRGVDGRKN